MSATRRYDIDSVRVIAIGLLLLYHTAIGFQSWGIMIGFITTEKPWGSVWVPMALLNVWRIPLLFFVSGMGVYFAMQHRTWKELMLDRVTRIFIPYLFGMFVICPVSIYIWQKYYNFEPTYNMNPGHLWFLGNILTYVVLLSPVFFYLKRNENGKLVTGIKKILSNPLGLLPVVAAFVVEAVLVNPKPYELYAMTLHGFFLGLLAFFFGFCFVLSGSGFLEMILKWKWVFLSLGVALFTVRLLWFDLLAPGYLLAVESNCWILSVLAFGYKYLNHPSKTLSYLSQAAYPVYIMHMIFLFLGSVLIFKLDIAIQLKFLLVLLFTGMGSLAFYELIIRRVNFIKPLFGVKPARRAKFLSFARWQRKSKLPTSQPEKSPSTS